MDFFTELLESFSRKHDRKLRLLEQDEQRVAQAEEAIKSAVAANLPQKGAPVTVGNAKVSHTGTVAGAYNFATYDFNTGKLSPKGKSDFGRVVSAVIGEEDKGEENRITTPTTSVPTHIGPTGRDIHGDSGGDSGGGSDGWSGGAETRDSSGWESSPFFKGGRVSYSKGGIASLWQR